MRSSAALPADLLRCPVCAQRDHEHSLTAVSSSTFGCSLGHRFDLSKYGYLTLVTGRKSGFRSDTTAMLQARARWLGSGHYDPIVTAITAATTGVTLEVGAGTGHYLAAAPAQTRLGIDLSPAAARFLARRGLGAVVADVWSPWPVRSSAVDTVLSVFAPRNPAETVRVLRPGGHLVVVHPLPGHLAQAVTRYGMLEVAADKTAAIDAALLADFGPPQRRELRYRIRPTPAEVTDLVLMGPSAFHLDTATVQRQAETPGGDGIDVAVAVATYPLRSAGAT